MNIAANDLFIASTSVDINVHLVTDDGREAHLSISRSTDTLAQDVNVVVGPIGEGLKYFSESEKEELIDYVKSNSALLMTRCLVEARESKEEKAKEQLPTSKTKKPKKDLQK